MLRHPHPDRNPLDHAFELGALTREANLKWRWEPDAVAGGNQRIGRQQGGGAANARRHAESAAVWAEWQAEADRLFACNRHLSVSACASLVKKNLCRSESSDTIRRRITKKVGKAR